MATSIYEAARPYLDAWIDGVIAAAQDFGAPLGILVVNDGLSDARQALQRLAGKCELRLFDVESLSPAMTRKTMIEIAGRSDADAILFSDCDDIPCRQAVKLHLEALEQADFSYGNVIELGGADNSALYFDPVLLPRQAERGSLDRGNFVGFTNSAVNRRTLALLAPRTSVALADWDLFRQAVERGCRGRQTREPVAQYRIADNGIASVRPRDLGGVLDAKAAMARDFLQQQPDAEKFAPVIDFINARHYAAMGAAAQPILNQKSPWFRFIFDLHDAQMGLH